MSQGDAGAGRGEGPAGRPPAAPRRGSAVTGTGFTDAATWYASLPVLYASAAALITDAAGQVLLVKPNYRDHWTLPGGSASTPGRRKPRVPVKSARSSGSISRSAGCW